MAIDRSVVLRLSPEDIEAANKLEAKIDIFLKTKWIGPETVFNTEMVNLKYNICKELQHRYAQAGWRFKFNNPVVSHNNPFMIGAVQFEKALAYQPTEFHLTPQDEDCKECVIPAGANKKLINKSAKGNKKGKKK
jgi:hypothetical protein